MGVEVCVDSIQSIRNAVAGGCSRVELCANLLEGGTTPSIGMVVAARSVLGKKGSGGSTGVKLMCMIRPRGGDFFYDEDEMKVMIEDIRRFKPYADGVVFGCLNADGSVDLIKTKRLVAAAVPLLVTFHRAFDMTEDAIDALEEIIAIQNIQRILTSGLEETALAGKQMISKLIERADGRIVILPGCGITVDNVEELVKATRAEEIHVSGRKRIDSKMKFRRESVLMGKKPDVASSNSNNNSEFTLAVVDVDVIKHHVAVMEKYHGGDGDLKWQPVAKNDDDEAVYDGDEDGDEDAAKYYHTSVVYHPPFYNGGTGGHAYTFVDLARESEIAPGSVILFKTFVMASTGPRKSGRQYEGILCLDFVWVDCVGVFKWHWTGGRKGEF